MFLLDTNVISEPGKFNASRGDEQVGRWARSVRPLAMCISVISLLERWHAFLLLEGRDPLQAAPFRVWYEEQLVPEFSARTSLIDRLCAEICAELHVPDPRPERDAMIAATARVRGFVLVTRNVRDFEGTGLRIVNPWMFGN